MKLLVLLSILCLPLYSCAQQKTATKGEITTALHSYSDMMLDTMSPYMKCFDESKENLEDAIVQEYTDCVSEFSNDMNPTMYVSSIEAVNKNIGICTGYRFYNTFKGRIKLSHLSGQNFKTCVDYKNNWDEVIKNNLLNDPVWNFVPKSPRNCPDAKKIAELVMEQRQKGVDMLKLRRRMNSKSTMNGEEIRYITGRAYDRPTENSQDEKDHVIKWFGNLHYQECISNHRQK